ncbi:MAG: trans-sialidase, partial [Nitrosopumilus sp. H13]
MATKKPTKKDLEAKIADLEAKINRLSAELTKPAPKPEPAKLAEAPKPKPTEAPKPVSFQDALENAYRTAPMSDFHQYRAKVTGYAPAPN